MLLEDETKEAFGYLLRDLTHGSREKHRALILQWLKTHDKKKYKIVLCVLAKQ